MTYGKFGQALPRVEDRKLVTGRGCYVDDIALPGTVHGVLVYSNQAHARIKSIDTSRALQAPGVLAVLTARISRRIASAACRRFSCRRNRRPERAIARRAHSLPSTSCGTSAIAWHFVLPRHWRRRRTRPN